MAEIVVAGSGDEGENREPAGDELIEKLLHQRGREPDLDALAEHLLNEFDGLAGLARELKIEYATSSAGSTNRGYILRAVLELVKEAATRKGRVDPLQGVSSDELKAAIKKLSQEG